MDRNGLAWTTVKMDRSACLRGSRIIFLVFARMHGVCVCVCVCVCVHGGRSSSGMHGVCLVHSDTMLVECSSNGRNLRVGFLVFLGWGTCLCHGDLCGRKLCHRE